jgi:hypothetical protein
MNFDYPDDELAGLIEQSDADIPRVGVANSGRVNPVQQQLRREQPQPGLFQQNNWRPNMPSNGGYKKKRTSKNSKKYNSKKYNSKNYKNKKRQRQTRRSRKI